MTKEERSLYNKAYRKANLEKISKYQSNWRESNKDYNKDYQVKNNSNIQEYRKSFKHLPLVYLIVNEDYVGTTERLYKRIAEHKNLNKDVSEVIILCECKSRAEALEIEEALHKQGYKGKHNFNLYI